MTPFIEAAMSACREVHALIQTGSEELFESHQRGFGGDVSHGIDLLSEAICYRHLHPFGSVFSEESGWMDPKSESVIFIDPLDGSDNFLSRFPYFGISIALQKEGKTVEALVANFANGDVFVRTESEYFRTSLIGESSKNEIIPSLHPKIGLFEKAPGHPDFAANLIRNGLKFRSPGALALSLAYAPYANYVLFLGTMRPYDIEAGLYLSLDLHTFQNDRMILLSRDKTVFERILSIAPKEIF